jgi:hypothetical protein
MVYLEFGQDGLAEAHPLPAFELSQRTIKVVLAPSRQKCRPSCNDWTPEANAILRNREVAIVLSR